MYNNLYIQRGHGLFKRSRIQRGTGPLLKPYIQRGHGIGGILRGIYKFIAPKIKLLLSSGVAKHVIRHVVKRGKKRLIKAGTNILADTAEGANIKDSFRKEIDRQKNLLVRDIDNLRHTASTNIRKRPFSEPVKRKKKKKKKKIKNIFVKRVKHGDLFD